MNGAPDVDRNPSLPEGKLAIAPFQGNPSEWDDLVFREPGGTHFHRFGWRRVIERGLGHTCPFLGARDSSGELLGVLPLVYVGSPVFGRFLVSMPFLNYGGPLGSAEAIIGLSRTAVAKGRHWRSGLVELRSLVPLPLDWPVSHRKITVVLDLPSDPDSLFGGFKAKLRSQVRRPQKEGITVRFGIEHLGAFYRVFSRHMRDLGTPVLSRRFFDEMVAEFPDAARVAVAFLRDTPIAGGFGFAWKGEMELTWASSLARYNRTSANMLVYWEFLRRSIEEGLSRFNFGRCTPGSGTHRFKRQWGGEDLPLHWYQVSESGLDQTPSPDQPRYAWGPRVWRRMPLWLANRIGPHIVRLIP